MGNIIIIYELAGFGLVILWMWLDEILDLPHHLFSAKSTPINYVESLTETIVALILGGLVVFFTYKLLRRIKRLEGLLPVCAWCKKIRSNGRWIEMEEYVSGHSEADFTHTICPECKKKLTDENFSGVENSTR
ncbi:MAG: hypothetical protein U9N73_07020 [Candidatus Auribacterota bacterium]|nr:hypothetical protein [Candidatus Auribacterota bacterium]